MAPSAHGVFALTSFLVVIAGVSCQSNGQTTPTRSRNAACVTYQAQVKTSFHTGHTTKWMARRHRNMVITDVVNKRRDGVYWCQLKMRNEPMYRNFGSIRSHWYVTRGCSGLFEITECPPSQAPRQIPRDMAAMPGPLNRKMGSMRRGVTARRLSDETLAARTRGRVPSREPAVPQ